MMKRYCFSISFLHVIFVGCNGQYPSTPAPSGLSYNPGMPNAPYPYAYPPYPPNYYPPSLPCSNPYGSQPYTAAINSYGSLPPTAQTNYQYGPYAAPYAYPPANYMIPQRPQFPQYYSNPANAPSPSQAHQYPKGSFSGAPHQGYPFQQGPPAYPMAPGTMQPVYPVQNPVTPVIFGPVPNAPTFNAAGNGANVTNFGANVTDFSGNVTTENGQPSCDSNNGMVASSSLVNGSAGMPPNLQSNLVGSQFTTLFNSLPMQPFYPPGYGPSNPFVLSAVNPMSGANTSMWPMQQPFNPPGYPVSPYYPQGTIPSNQMSFPGNPAMPSSFPDNSASPTIISSNGETGSDVNSLPPQVKEFVDMIPDIMAMPENQQFSQGQSGLFGATQQPSSIGGLHKKSSLLKKKHLFPRRYYDRY